MKKRIFGLFVAGVAALSLASCDTNTKNINVEETVKQIITKVQSEDFDAAKTYSAITEQLTVEADVDLIATNFGYDETGKEVATQESVKIAGSAELNLALDINKEKLDALKQTDTIPSAMDAVKAYFDVSVDGSLEMGEKKYELDATAKAFNDGAKVFAALDVEKGEFIPESFRDVKYFLDLSEILNIPVGTIAAMGTKIIDGPSLDDFKKVKISDEEIKAFVAAFGLKVTNAKGTRMTFKMSPNAEKMVEFINLVENRVEAAVGTSVPVANDMISKFAEALTKLSAQFELDVDTLQVYEMSLDIGNAIKAICDVLNEDDEDDEYPKFNKCVLKLSSKTDYKAVIPTINTEDYEDASELVAPILSSIMGGGKRNVEIPSELSDMFFE